MTGFLLFWVLAVANLLNPVAALGGTAVALVWVFGRIEIAFAVVGFALTVLIAVAYWHDRYVQFGAAAYLVGAQFIAMVAWTAFVAVFIFIVREKEPFSVRAGRRF